MNWYDKEHDAEATTWILFTENWKKRITPFSLLNGKVFPRINFQTQFMFMKFYYDLNNESKSTESSTDIISIVCFLFDKLMTQLKFDFFCNCLFYTLNCGKKGQHNSMAQRTQVSLLLSVYYDRLASKRNWCNTTLIWNESAWYIIKLVWCDFRISPLKAP